MIKLYHSKKKAVNYILTKVEAIIKVLQDNNGIANWNIFYNELKKYYPNIDRSIEWKAGIRGVLYREIKNGRHFKRINDGVFTLSDYDETQMFIKPNANATMRETMTHSRLQQDKLRKIALEQLKKCPITHINDKRLLVTSHIKPWINSSDIERLDINNVFLLSPLFDKLFDSGLITFTCDKVIRISNELSHSNINKIGISNGQSVPLLPMNDNRAHYLEFHYNKIFIK